MITTEGVYHMGTPANYVQRIFTFKKPTRNCRKRGAALIENF
jgi:hypothetical protein